MKTLLLIVLLACNIASARAAEALGRLFFTPEQRQQLDQQNRQQGRGNVRISGYLLTMPTGRATAWINGKQVRVNSKGEVLQLDADDDEVSSLTVTTPKGAKARARVGDTVDTDTGAVQSGDPAVIQRNRSKGR